MEESTSREQILKKVRNALINRTDPPFPNTDFERSVYAKMEDPPDIHFATELKKAGGNFIYCESEEEFIQGFKHLTREKRWDPGVAEEEAVKVLLGKGGIPYASMTGDPAGLRLAMTGCEFLVARLGSILVSSRQGSGRRLFILPDIHVVIAKASQIVPDLKDALAGIRRKYEPDMPSQMTLITGPSRTADIEKTLVMGAHGPRELYVFLIEDRIL